MKTFNFDFECCMCKGHRQRKAEALNCIFVEGITNNITWFLSCYKCVEMRECDIEYQKPLFKDYNKIERQINCITNVSNNLNFKSNHCKKLRTLKDLKKAYL